MSNGLSESSSNRQVGMKSKREEGEGDDDVEWEEAPIEGKSNNLNLIALLSY
jgi:transcription initiation factor TFIIE subunit alpha